VVYLAAGAVCSSFLPDPAKLDVAGIALAQGFILAVALSATLPISGGFLNPAVTLTLWVFKRMDGERALWLVGAQLLGAILAGLFVWLTFSDVVLRNARLGTPHINRLAFGEGSSWLGTQMTGIGVELLLTFIVTFTIFMTILDPRAPRMGGLTVGLAWTATVVMGLSITGAATNPARWFGPAIWERIIRPDALDDHLVYWIGPTLGALLAGAVYTLVLIPGERERAHTAAEPHHAPAGAGPAKVRK
jgi:MIP family channel proteins